MICAGFASLFPACRAYLEYRFAVIIKTSISRSLRLACGHRLCRHCSACWPVVCRGPLASQLFLRRIFAIVAAFLLAALPLLAIQSEEKFTVLGGPFDCILFMPGKSARSLRFWQRHDAAARARTSVGVYMFATPIDCAARTACGGRISDSRDLQLACNRVAVLVCGALLIALVIHFIAAMASAIQR